MTLPISGQNAQPVSVVTDEATIGAPAFPVYGYDSVPTDRGVLAGAALRVKVLSASDLLENGGRYVLQGSPIAVPVYSVPDTYPVQGNVAIAVYPINNWPDPPPPSDVLILDQFVDADGTALPSHVIAPTNIPATVWSYLFGTGFEIQSNAVVLAGAAGDVCAVCDPGVADCTISADVTTPSASSYIGIFFRILDASNFLDLQIRYGGGPNVFRLGKVEAGSYTELVTGGTPALNTTYAIRIVAAGTNITVYVDDVLTLTLGSAFSQTATKCGIYNNTTVATGAKVENFKVTAL